MDPIKKKNRNIMILIILLIVIAGIILFVKFALPPLQKFVSEHKVQIGVVIAGIGGAIGTIFVKKKSKNGKKSDRKSSDSSNSYSSNSEDRKYKKDHDKQSHSTKKPVVTKTKKDPSSPIEFVNARVDIVIDGDTAMFKYENVDSHIKGRFIGLNCPEATKTHEPYGKEATEFAKKGLLKKEVFIEYDEVKEDQHGRHLIYIWLEKPTVINDEEVSKKLFNAILVKEGYARFFNDKNDRKYHEYFRKYEQEAKDNKKGMWSLDVYEKERTTKKIWLNKDK